MSDISCNDQKSNIDEMINELQQNKLQIYENITMNETLRRRNTEIERMLYNLCDHVWVREYSDCGPYSKSRFLCSKCDLYK